jgi:uncharacterized protein YbjT (DUF2867 family)
MKTALLSGSSGLVGKHLLSLLLSSDRYSKVIALTRRDLPLQDPKLIQVKTDLSSLAQHLGSVRADDVFCCLGTTIRKAGSREKFYEVDFTYPFALAKIMKERGSLQFLLVSALGADKESSFFYNRVKGEVEEVISHVGYETFHIFRPSLLLGQREEKRAGEHAAKVFFNLFGVLVPEKYQPVHASQVASAMLLAASQEVKGKFIHLSSDIRKTNAGNVS